MTRARSVPLTAVALLALAGGLAGCTSTPAPATDAPPTAGGSPPAVGTVAVVGDSMSLGENACRSAGPCAEASWALGTDERVDSIARRLSATLGSEPSTVVLAKNGATVDDRLSTIDDLAESGADLVLVQIGANDACTPSTASITPPAEFAASYRRLLSGIRDALPSADIVAVSVPNLLHLWEVGHTDPAAVRAWDSSPSCRSLLADADSDAAVDDARRAAVDTVVQGYNAAIEQACAEIAECFADGGAVYDLDFTIDQISSIDHFHANSTGQALVAAQVWPAVERALAP